MKKNSKQPTETTAQQVDLFFDKHSLTPRTYFLVGFVLSCTVALAIHFLEGHAFSWILTLPVVALFYWLLWLGPRYLQRYDRTQIVALGTLAFFAPTLIYFCMLWLGQPGWPLDSLMGDKYADFPAFLSAVALTLVVYCLLLLRMKLYNIVSVKRHSKKDLFQ